MTNRAPVALTLTFAVCMLATGIPYWRVPYAQAALPDALVGFGLVVVVAAALWLCLSSRASLKQAAVVAGLGPVAAVLLRVIVGVVQDPSSHNLWPFELLIAAAVSFPLSGVGALAGAALAALLRRS